MAGQRKPQPGIEFPAVLGGTEPGAGHDRRGTGTEYLPLFFRPRAGQLRCDRHQGVLVEGGAAAAQHSRLQPGIHRRAQLPGALQTLPDRGLRRGHGLPLRPGDIYRPGGGFQLHLHLRRICRGTPVPAVDLPVLEHRPDGRHPGPQHVRLPERGAGQPAAGTQGSGCAPPVLATAGKWPVSWRVGVAQPQARNHQGARQ